MSAIWISNLQYACIDFHKLIEQTFNNKTLENLTVINCIIQPFPITTKYLKRREYGVMTIPSDLSWLRAASWYGWSWACTGLSREEHRLGIWSQLATLGDVFRREMIATYCVDPCPFTQTQARPEGIRALSVGICAKITLCVNHCGSEKIKRKQENQFQCCKWLPPKWKKRPSICLCYIHHSQTSSRASSSEHVSMRNTQIRASECGGKHQ